MIGRHFPSLYSLPLIDSGKYPIISTFFTFALFSSWKTKGIMRGNHVKDNFRTIRECLFKHFHNRLGH